MKNSYTQLIEEEQAKIALLRAKIAECERRVEVLKTFLNPDELDTWLSKSLEQDSQKAPPGALTQGQLPVVDTGSREYELPKRRLSNDVQRILRFIGNEGKTLDELEAFCADMGYTHNRGSLRSLASNYKTKHDFISSPKLGFFQLTERGLKFLNTHYPDVPSETPPVSAEGVSDTSTEASLEAGTDSDGLV